MNRRRVGNAGEALAAIFLEERGCRILARGYRGRRGEIDLIARDDRALVFCEVKYRASAACGYPQEAVDGRKQRRIRGAAADYLYENRFPEDTPCRFDVVAILGEEITWIQDAF